jgi:hypothetical protein
MSIFNYYPLIDYKVDVFKSDIRSTNIMVEVEVVERYLKDYNSFFKYTLRDGERADMVAYDQYGDSSLDWIIYLVNKVVDPYKDWLMDDKQFRQYMEAKYNTSADKLTSTLIPSSIAYYYYKGLPSDSKETIDSYNYRMTYHTYTKLGSPAGWQAVSLWDYESEKNQARREINLLKPAFITDFKQQIKDLLNNG